MKRIQNIQEQIQQHSFINPEAMLEYRSNILKYKYESTMFNVDPDTVQKRENLDKYNFSDYFTQFIPVVELYTIQKDKIENTKYITPQGGWINIVLPFEKDKYLKYKFESLESNQLRIGKLLEFLDYCAGISVFQSLANFTEIQQQVVTASLDNVQFFKNGQVPGDKNLYVQCYPTWAHKTSIEIRIDVMGINKENQKDLYCSAYFLMVLKNSNNKKNLQLPEFKFEGSDQEVQKAYIRYDTGRQRQNIRITKKVDLEYKKPFTQEENQKMHQIYLDYNNLENQKEKYVSQKKTRVTNTQLIQMQDKNIYGKIFGGLILREAYDLAFIVVHKFSQGQVPRIYHIDDVHFIIGASVGSLIEYTGEITYVDGHLVHVQVDVVQITHKDVKKKTTEVHLTMMLDKPFKNVLPYNYKSSLSYLEGQRRVNYVSKRQY